MRYIWINILLIALFVGTVNAQTPQPTPLSPYSVYAEPSNLNLLDKIDYLEKQIAKLEKTIKEHIGKPHVFYSDFPKGTLTNQDCKPRFLINIPCDDKIKKSH